MESFLENPFLNLSLHPKYKLSYAAEDATADHVLSALCDVINLHCLRMSCSRIVRSSWPRIRDPSDTMIVGRMMGGGTSNASTRNRSRGWVMAGLNPIAAASSSVIGRMMSRAWLAVKTGASEHRIAHADCLI